MFDVSEMVYALYVQNWIDENTTAEMRLQNIREYYSYCQECLAEDEDPESYEDWLFESGFHGSLYVCYDEFCDAEYRDEDFVRSLLCNNESLMDLYFQDIDNDDEEEEDEEE